ncbi:MAG: P1 family peptidase [Gemmatimonadota bacterium]|nr:P1 family peptidase [Gemmatimonadota bacterium]
MHRPDRGRPGSRHLARAVPGMIVLAAVTGLAPAAGQTPDGERPRLRDIGVAVGRMSTGPANAITDVPGVLVGHETVLIGDSIRTGVTAILPHDRNVFTDRPRAAISVGNGFGKLLGVTQVNELGELETPILLTGTLSVFRAADALLDTLLAHPENVGVRSMNPVVGETNDGYLSDIRARPIRPEHVRAALRHAAGGPVEEGSVGAGTGTTALGWKGGIGTASRVVETDGGPATVGVLVQTNFGGGLTIAGVPVGEELETRGLRSAMAPFPASRDGSVMIVVATDVPLAHRELERVALRSFLGIGRTGSYMSYGSGDYAIAFSVGDGDRVRDGRLLSRIFEAVVEATEEAVINSLFRATTVTGHGGRTMRALPIDETVEILRERGAIPAGDGSSE